MLVGIKGILGSRYFSLNFELPPMTLCRAMTFIFARPNNPIDFLLLFSEGPVVDLPFSRFPFMDEGSNTFTLVDGLLIKSKASEIVDQIQSFSQLQEAKK